MKNGKNKYELSPNKYAYVLISTPLTWMNTRHIPSAGKRAIEHYYGSGMLLNILAYIALHSKAVGVCSLQSRRFIELSP